jgi:hypothetical protein
MACPCRPALAWADRVRTPLQMLTDPMPAPHLIVDRPHQEGSRRVGQLRDNADQLAVKVAGPLLVAMSPLPGDGHDRAVSAGQPHRDIAVVVERGGRDIPCADDLRTLIVRDLYVFCIHACLFPPTIAPCGPSPLRAAIAGVAARPRGPG